MFIERKKVEIVIESVKIPKIVKLMDRLNLPGYTIIQDIVGRGTHGICDAEELTDVLNNSYVLVICSAEKSQEFATALQPILKKFGGICFVSDVQKVITQ